MAWLRRATAFILAVAVTAAVGAAAHAQFVIASLNDLGHAVTFPQRLHWTLHDIVGMFPTYAPIVAVAFLIALPAAFLISRNRARLRTLGYTLAGAVAIVCALLIMKQLLDISGIAGARTAMGILLQGLAGALGGWVFAVLGRRKA